MFYLIFNKPFTVNIDNYILFANEIPLVVFYYYIAACQINKIEIDLEDSAIFSIRIVTLTLGFNVFANFFKVVQSLILKIKSKCIRDKIKTLPTDNVASVEKFESKV